MDPNEALEGPRRYSTNVQQRASFVSDCGLYIAVPYGDGVAYDVIEVAAKTVWLWRRYKATGFDDSDRRHTHPEFSRMVMSWSKRGDRRGDPAFALCFADLDRTIATKPWTGNGVLRGYEATFRSRVPRNHTRRIAQMVTDIATAVQEGTDEGHEGEPGRAQKRPR